MNGTLRLVDLWPPGRVRTASEAEHEILRQAIRLFGRRGFGGTSMRAIATAADVTAPLIGYHFRNKEGLFEACVQVTTASSTELLHVPPQDAMSIADRVRVFAAGHVDFAQRYPEALRFILTVAYGPEDAQPPVDFAAHWRPVVFDLIGRFEDAIERGEFTPRSGATVPRLVRHLLNLVHTEVMGAYEKERFLTDDDDLTDFMDEGDLDLVEDLVTQFFQGAGVLHARGETEEPSR